MKTLKNFFILATLLLVAGCKFETPLTEKPTRPVDPSLLGSWFSLNDGKPLEIYRFSDSEYLAIFDGAPYVCTHSDVAGTNFMSCRQLKNDPEVYGKYAYVAYKMEKKELVLIPLGDSIGFKENLSAAQNRQLLEKAIKSGTALDKDPEHEMRYKKASDSKF